jgi:hypothetical protein
MPLYYALPRDRPKGVRQVEPRGVHVRPARSPRGAKC